jgi:hypothetical protein|tara:strand:+ start:162 stop:371 length:210 start_codon:yes stop_codon:yes gene_type:complete
LLNFIEERLNKMIGIWRIKHETANSQEMALPKGDTREDRDLLHGPQSKGMDQDDSILYLIKRPRLELQG